MQWMVADLHRHHEPRPERDRDVSLLLVSDGSSAGDSIDPIVTLLEDQ